LVGWLLVTASPAVFVVWAMLTTGFLSSDSIHVREALGPLVAFYLALGAILVVNVGRVEKWMVGALGVAGVAVFELIGFGYSTVAVLFAIPWAP
jgi:hypothetical protein